MKSFTFVPSTDTGKDLWLKNFASKLPLYAEKYSITAAELADMNNSSTAFTGWLNYTNQVNEYQRRLVAFKNELRDGIRTGNIPSVYPQPLTFGSQPVVDPGIFDRAASYGNRIKKHIAYTEADGKDLGIAAIITAAVDFETAKPTLKVRLMKGGKPEIDWIKGKMDGVEILVDRGQGYELLAVDMRPPYIDHYELEPGETATFRYQAVYIKNDEHVGQYSDEVSITVSGRKIA